MSQYFNDNVKDLGLSKPQKDFVSRIGSILGSSSYQVEPQIISQLHLANTINQSSNILSVNLINAAGTVSRTIEKQVEILVHSNERLSAANEKHTSAMVWLTWALVIVGVLGIVAQLFISYH